MYFRAPQFAVQPELTFINQASISLYPKLGLGKLVFHLYKSLSTRYAMEETPTLYFYREACVQTVCARIQCGQSKLARTLVGESYLKDPQMIPKLHLFYVRFLVRRVLAKAAAIKNKDA